MFRQKYVQFVIAHSNGEKNGKIAGKMLFTVQIDVGIGGLSLESSINRFPKPTF